VKLLGALSKVTVLSVILAGLQAAPVVATNPSSIQFQTTKSNQIDQQHSFESIIHPRSSSTPSPVRNIRVASKGGFGIQVSWSKPQRSGNAPVECFDNPTKKTTLVPVCYSVVIEGNGTAECSSTTQTSCFVSSPAPVGNITIEVRARNGDGLESSASVSHWYFTQPYLPNLISYAQVTPGTRSLKIGLAEDIVPWFYDLNSEFSQGALISALEVLAYPAGTAIEDGYTFPKPLGKCTMSRSGKNSFAKGCTISKLTNGASYDLLFRARNAAGWSNVASYLMSFSHTPTPVAPGVPRNVKVTPIKDGLKVTWSPPASDGGADPMDLTDSGGPNSVKVQYEVTVNGVWAHNCLSWKTSCEIIGDFISPGEINYVSLYSFNSVSTSSPVYRSGVPFSTPQFKYFYEGEIWVEEKRHRVTWNRATNVWNDMGDDITSIEAMAFRSDTNFDGATPKPVAKCSATKSGSKPLAGSCLLPTLPRGMFIVAIRAKNRAGWSEYVWTTSNQFITN
jgi:hypothetical protein